MPFTSAKRKTGQPGKSGQHTTAQVRSAGKARRPTRERSSSSLEIPQPRIFAVTGIGPTSFDIDVTYNNAQKISVNVSKTLCVVTVNQGIPTPDQIIAGQDSTGAAAAFNQSNITIEPLSISAVGLAALTEYFIYLIVQVDPGEPKAGQYSIIAEDEAVT